MNRSLWRPVTGFASILLFISILMVSCGSDKADSKVVVKIDNDELTLDMLKEMIPEGYRNTLTHEQIQTYIDMWVAKELLYKEAMNQGLHRKEELFKALKKAEKDFLVEAILDSLIRNKIVVSEDEAIEFYERNHDNFLTEKTEIRAQHILVETLQEANAVQRRLSAGEDFEQLAREVSLDYERNDRIDTGYFSEDDVVPEISRYVFRYRSGSTTRPIKSQFGYHVFKILEKRNPNTIRNFEEVRNKIIDRLVNEKREDLYVNYITDLRDKTSIEQNFEYLEELYVGQPDTSRSIVPDTLNFSE
ncbi:MAG: peptidyl-prolyl cis-trans isomerase [candidate division KSB1 bacterium]|nr:peptidyl-prolyl cis-trans isomerase [candidate division KSB1 bacterium]